MNIKTQANAKPTIKRETFKRGKSIVDKTGSINVGLRVKQMQMAGKLLQSARENQFDILKNQNLAIESEFIDITREKGVDLVDIMNAKQKLEERFREKRKKIIEEVRAQQAEEGKRIMRKQILDELEKKEKGNDKNNSNGTDGSTDSN